MRVEDGGQVSVHGTLNVGVSTGDGAACPTALAPSPPVPLESPPPVPPPISPPPGFAFRGYQWFAGDVYQSCTAKCSAESLSCVDLHAADYLESSCAADTAVCPNMFPDEAALQCGGDGDAPKVMDGSKCYYRNNPYDGLTCGTYFSNQRRICACE